MPCCHIKVNEQKDEAQKVKGENGRKVKSSKGQKVKSIMLVSGKLE